MDESAGRSDTTVQATDGLEPTAGSAPGYLDAASTEPLHPAAAEVLQQAYAEGWADPQRQYREARRARQLLENARAVVAAVLGARADEITFTASGTQSVHLGVTGVLHGRRRVSNVLVASAVEHSCVLHAGRWHQERGGTLRTVPVDRTGQVDPETLVGMARDAALVCLQSANHEVGTTQPVEQVVTALAAEHGGQAPPVLVDAAQSAGRVSLPGGWSVLTASAHKWGGPAGVGILAVRRGTRFRAAWPTAERGGGIAAGFENVPGALAAAAALRARHQEARAVAARQRALVDLVRAEVPRRVPDVEVVGHASQRLPHVVTFSCLYVDGEALLTELDRAGFAVSSGSSCTASALRPSHVLEAMGVLSHGNVRVSMARTTQERDVLAFLDVLPTVVARIRDRLGVAGL